MLKDDFFTVKEQVDSDSGMIYRLNLNASHPIFRAHFAGNPVMPGACITQMIKELASVSSGSAYFISSVRNMKFLHVINPLENPEISVRLVRTPQESGCVSVSAFIYDGDVVFSKATVVLKPVSSPVLQGRMESLRLCVVVPTYNNRQTLAAVLHDVLHYTSSIIVVNDGSTDDTAGILNAFAGKINVVSYMPNKGKGYALKSGFNEAEKLGYRGAITIDSDGQHFASEIERFVEYAETYPDMLLIGQRTTEGNMPAKNSFANKFSNFWFAVQTAYRLGDTQNGFRLYPLSAMRGLRPVSSRYEAELEMLVRSAWKGIRVVPVPVRVYYPPEGERVTHFRPGRDFFRISLLNALFTLLAIVYGYPSMFIHRLFTKKNKS